MKKLQMTCTDPPLSENGCKQAQRNSLLMEIQIKEVTKEAHCLNTNPLVLSSPYLCSIQSAIEFAQCFNTKVCIEPALSAENHMPKQKQMEVSDRYRYYPGVSIDEALYKPFMIDSDSENDSYKSFQIEKDRSTEDYPLAYFNRMSCFAEHLDKDENVRGKITIMVAHGSTLALTYPGRALS